MKWLSITVYGNTVQQWMLAFLLAAVTLITLRLLFRFVTRRLRAFAQRTETYIDDLIADLLQRTNAFVLLMVALYAGSLVLVLPPRIVQLVTTLTVVVLLLQAGIWANAALGFFLRRYREQRAEVDAATLTSISALGFVGRLVLWSVVLLLALDNLGIDVTALIAGLGIGGIAVALAVQNILSDLFASLSIVLDKPFVLGDFIIVDSYLGTVEHIGLKTTRIRSLFGEQIVFSNADLLNSRIRNYKRMYERRVVFTFGVTYETPVEKLEKIPAMVEDIVTAQDLARFDRAHFKEFGDFSLNFEVVYYVQDPDYRKYMDIQQAINLELVRRFQAEGIEFAYPTQTVYVQGSVAGSGSGVLVQ